MRHVSASCRSHVLHVILFVLMGQQLPHNLGLHFRQVLLQRGATNRPLLRGSRWKNSSLEHRQHGQIERPNASLARRHSPDEGPRPPPKFWPTCSSNTDCFRVIKYRVFRLSVFQRTTCTYAVEASIWTTSHVIKTRKLSLKASAMNSAVVVLPLLQLLSVQ